VWCDDGRIVVISADPADAPSGTFDRSVDASGRIVIPGFVNSHLHPDKSLLGDYFDHAEMTLEESIQLTWKFKSERTPEEISERASLAIRECVIAGCTTVRAFCDVDKVGKLTPYRGLKLMKEKVRGLCDIQIVAFPQEGLLRPRGDVELLRSALKEGADVVGGLTNYERTPAKMRRHIDLVMDLAQEFDVDVHVLADMTDDPAARALEYLAEQTVDRGWEGRVTASHCTALASYDHIHAEVVIEMVKEAGISISANPHVTMLWGEHGRDRGNIRRGCTRIEELLDAGANVCAGQDDIDDPYYPFGRGDQLEVAWFFAHVARLSTIQGIRKALDAVTVNSARALRLEGYGTEPGCRADLVVLEGRSLREAMRLQLPRAFVIKDGRVIVEHTLNRVVADSIGP
jgi:cytosine/creatinine deaminase